MKRPLFVVGASMLFALNVLYRLNIKAAWVTSAVALVAFFVFLVFRRIRRDGTLPAVAFTLAVCSLYFAVFSVNVQKTVLPLVGDGKTVHTVKGEIVSLPYINNGRFYCIIKTDEIDSEKISTKIRLSSDENLYSEPFDRVEGEFTLYALGGSSDEMTDYYRSKGLYLGAYTDSDVISEGRSGFHPMYYVLKLKSAVINAIEENLPNECGGILTGFLLGEKSFIPSRTLNDFSLIGSYHLLAVSGLHVTVWAAFVYSLLKLLYIKRRLRSALSIAFVLFFEALTGFNPPVVRAGTLAIFVFLGNIVKNEADSLNSIGLAVTLMLFVNPFAANSASLWLSSFASVGIILISAEVYNKLDFIKTVQAFSEG